MSESSKHPTTQTLSKGYQPTWSEGSAVPPVFRTSTFVFKDCAEGKRAFEIAYGLSPAKKGEVPALIYSRVNNPNVEMVEERITVWDPKAESAALFASGMGAISGTCLTFLRPGDELVFSDPVYGGTELFMRHVLPSFGIKTHPMPAGSSEAEMDAAVAACEGRCKVLYIETPANPTILVTDIKAAARVAKKHSKDEDKGKVWLVVDNTFLGPIFCQPHVLGADLVVYSATKFIGGHSDVVSGVVTGPSAAIARIKGTRTVFGSNTEPDTAWLILRSLGTLNIRMRAQAESAARIVEALAKHPMVEAVSYPGRPSSRPNNEEQLRIFREQYSGSGSLITFWVKGGEAETFKFLDALHEFRLAVSLGSIESLIQHPSSMTHSDMSPEEKLKAGITPNLVRASIGLEHADDLIHDLVQALDKMSK